MGLAESAELKRLADEDMLDDETCARLGHLADNVEHWGRFLARVPQQNASVQANPWSSGECRLKQATEISMMKLFGAVLVGLGGICIAVTANAAGNKDKVVKPQLGISMKPAQSKTTPSKKEKVKPLIQIDQQTKQTPINVVR